MITLARAVMELIDVGHRRISARLDLTRMRVMGLIAARDAVRPAVIARELQLTKSAVSRHLAALDDAGEIELDEDPDDGRTHLVRLSDAGHTRIAQGLEMGTQRFAEAVASWSEEDIVAARVSVQRLMAAWADPPGGSGAHPARRTRGRRPIKTQRERDPT